MVASARPAPCPAERPYPSMRHQVQCKVLAHTQVGPTEYRLLLQAPDIARDSLPGQFVQLLYGAPYGPAMRRPFSVFECDRTAGTFAVIYMTRGNFTVGMTHVAVGEWVSAVGPLGNTFSCPDTPGIRHLLVAGGVGAPPMRFLAESLTTAGSTQVVVINGARTASHLIASHEMAALPIRLVTMTDDGSAGEKGLVTAALAREIETGGPCAVYSCGPTPMLRAVSDLCASKGVPCQISVETVMPCGVGVCMGCVLKVRDPQSEAGFVYRRACCDGPVFEASEVIW